MKSYGYTKLKICGLEIFWYFVLLSKIWGLVEFWHCVSSMILYWKARLVQNTKFRWLKAMLTSYTFMQILRLKVLYTSEKLSSWWIQNLRFWQILAKYTSMQNFRLRVKNTIKSCVIHHWKAKVLKNQKFEVMFNFENIYF